MPDRGSIEFLVVPVTDAEMMLSRPGVLMFVSACEPEAHFI